MTSSTGVITPIDSFQWRNYIQKSFFFSFYVQGDIIFINEVYKLKGMITKTDKKI